MAFEALSGIRMNLGKTELYTINIPTGIELANHFRCKLGKFPIKYLGLPLHNSKLKKADWSFLIEKIEKKLQNWKGQMLSIGGRHTLVNSVLSAVPLYTLSVY